MEEPGSSGGGGGGDDDMNMDITDWLPLIVDEEAMAAAWDPMPHHQTIGVEGVVQHQHQHQHQLGIVDQHQQQQLAGEEREEQLHQQQATGTAEGVLPRGAAVPVVASVGFQPGAVVPPVTAGLELGSQPYAAAAAATRMLDAAPGPSQSVIQSFQQVGLSSAYWRFALRIEEAVKNAGVVIARCLLCQCVMKVYDLIVEKEEQRKRNKRKFDVLMTSRGKSAQVGTSVNTRTRGINHFVDINQDLDEVLTRAGEIRVLHQTGPGDLNQQVNRIIELVGKIRLSVHHIAGSTGVSQLLPSHTIPGVSINPPNSTTQATTAHRQTGDQFNLQMLPGVHINLPKDSKVDPATAHNQQQFVDPADHQPHSSGFHQLLQQSSDQTNIFTSSATIPDLQNQGYLNLPSVASSRVSMLPQSLHAFAMNSPSSSREPALLSQERTSGLSIPTFHAPPATGENEAITEDFVPPAPVPGDGQTHDNVPPHLNTD